MPSALSPPRWRLTQHALDRMNERGLTREQVVQVIEDPDLTHDSTVDGVRVAQRGDVRVPYNTTTGDVLTVARRDEEQHPEQHMSGWINLDARQAQKLLTDWGFTVHSEKGQSDLWTHPIDDQKRLIPFSNPKRGARANGKSSFRTAANVVGVSVNAFLKGPDEEWAEKMRLLAEVDDINKIAYGPDPLGIRDTLVIQRTDQLTDEAMRFVESQKTKEEPVAGRKVSDKHIRQALEAITDEPLTTQEVATLLAIHSTTAGRALAALVEAGKAVRRPAKPEEVTNVGNPGVMFLAGPPGTEIPTRIPATAQPETAVPTPEPVQETPVQIVPSNNDTEPDHDQPAEVKEKLFTATGTPWPTGGILIQDEDGVFYVARKLVEEGR